MQIVRRRLPGFSVLCRAGSLVILLMLVAGPAMANKIGYVDARRLVDESNQGKAQLEQLEEEFATRNREIKAQFELYKSKEAELEKNSVLLPPDEKQQKTAELQEMQRELQRAQRNYNEEYNARRSRSLAELQKVISEVVIFVAKRDEYDLIVQQAVFASDAVDVTGIVLEELNSRSEQ